MKKLSSISPRERALTFAVISLIFNLFYAFYNGALGIATGSVWFIFTCIYYLSLIVMRFVALMNSKDEGRVSAIMRFTGIILAEQSIILGAILYISLTLDVATEHGTITMITIATYTFTKLAFATVKAVRHRGVRDSLSSIRAISYAEIAVSVFTMQRSMLVSFGESKDVSALGLNIMTGVAVCIFTFVLGIFMVRSSRKEREDDKIQNCGKDGRGL